MDPDVTITPYKDGPLLLRGPFALVDQEGGEVETQRKVVALCRCGRSGIRPFCDGSHKAAGFTAPGGSPRVCPRSVRVARTWEWRPV